jgi:lysophospholipase L1-like esterase
MSPALDSETRTSLLHLATVTTLFVAFGVAAYLIPTGTVIAAVELDRLKPYGPSDRPPLADLWDYRDKELPTFAGGGGSYIAPEQLTSRAARNLGEAVARNLGEGVSTPPSEDTSGQSPAIRIDPNEYADLAVEIENPRALVPFFEALEATARRAPGAITRIGHYGDSSIATDLITSTARRNFQQRFGDAGHGFHLIARGAMPYRHRNVFHRASGEWGLRMITMGQDRGGLYGYGGVSYAPRSDARALFGTAEDGNIGRAVSRFEILYRSDPRGGRLRYRVDGGELQTLDTSGEPADRVARIDVPDGEHRLELRTGGGGPVKVYGVVMERPGPGVVYDSLGLVGARARRLLNYDADHIREQLTQRDLDLLILGFGGNEADDPIRSMENHYEPEFAAVIRRMRAARRDMACIIFAPLDQAGRDDHGHIRTMPTIPVIVEAQRAAAEREGCAFFNTYEAMGGEGAMAAWARSTPRLAMSDYRHATPEGYQVIGNLFYKALLKAFADHLVEAR